MTLNYIKLQISFFHDIFPAILGFSTGLIWISVRLEWLEWIKINDRYKIILPSLVTVILPFTLMCIFDLITGLDSSANWFKILENLAKVAPLGILFTIIIGFLNYFSNQKTKRDEEITKQAILALERAYEILTDNNQNINPPLSDRYNWLTTHRMLESYEKLKKRLNTDLYKIICEEQEEYWRHRFYLLIKDDHLYPLSYFEYNPGIAPKSAVTIFGFAALGFPESEESNDIDKISERLAGNLQKPTDLMRYLNKYSDALEDNLFSRAFKRAFILSGLRQKT